MNFQTVQEVLPRSMANLTAKFVQYDWKIQTAFYVAASITLLYTLVYHLLPMVTRRRRLSNEALKSIKKNYTLENPEVIIVGAGIAGPALAKALGDQGNEIINYLILFWVTRLSYKLSNFLTFISTIYIIMYFTLFKFTIYIMRLWLTE
jgi:FlaA1/EpsC-like NDP-sugar epimerase